MAISERSRLQRSTFLVLLALAAYGSWRTLEPVWVPVLLGMVIAVGVYPLHERLLRRLHGRHPGLPAALLTAAAMLLLVSLLGFMVLVVGHRVLELARDVAARYQRNGTEGVLGRDLRAFLSRLGLEPSSLGERVAEMASKVATWAGSAATSILSGLFTVVFTFIFTAITSYYLLREGAGGTSWLVETLPLPEGQARQIVRDVRDVTRAMLLSTALVSLYQGVAAGIGYWILGVESPLVWASLTGVASILPAVGTALVWIPICIVVSMRGHLGQGLAVAAWSLVAVVFVADYVLRPKLVRARIKMNDLLVFIAIFGGIEAFGILGVIVGPIAVAVLLSLLRIYQRDYRPEGPLRTPDVTRPQRSASQSAP